MSGLVAALRLEMARIRRRERRVRAGRDIEDLHQMRSSLLLSALLCAGAVAGCHKTTAPGGTTSILSVTPSIVSPSAAPQVMRFSGANLSGSYSLLMISPGGLITELPPAQLQVLGSDTFEASVILPTPGVYAFEIKSPAGEVSSAFQLTVGSVTGFPTITTITPSATRASTLSQTFSIGGTVFEQGLNIVLAAPDGTIVMVSPADVFVASDTVCQANLVLNKTGAYLVSIVNPSGGTSNLFSISVTR
jgi:hypothetical protein